MRCALLSLFVVWLAASAPPAVAQRDLDDLDAEKARQARMQRLGEGPIYLADVLYREYGTRRLFLLQTVLSPGAPRSAGLPGIGLDSRGEVQPPPTPGQVRMQRVRDLVRLAPGQAAPPPPFAETTHYIGVRLSTRRAVDLELHVSDLGTGMKPPDKVGDVTVHCFQSAIFRIERLSVAQAQELQPLRQDPEYFRRRTTALRKDLLAAHRKTLLQSDYSLMLTVKVLEDLSLLDEVRARLRAWVAKSPQEVDGKGWPSYLCGSLAHNGTPEDAEHLRQVVQRHPAHGWHLSSYVFEMIERHGTRAAMPLLRDLLENEHPERGNDPVMELLRKLDTSVPEPTVGDACLLSLCQRFHLQPAQYGFQRVHGRLLDLVPRDQLAKSKVAEKIRYNEWRMLAAGDRHRGVQAALAWLQKHTPPPPQKDSSDDGEIDLPKLLDLKR